MHRKILSAQARLEGVPGGRLQLKRLQGNNIGTPRLSEQDDSETALTFEILNPIYLFPKDREPR